MKDDGPEDLPFCCLVGEDFGPLTEVEVEPGIFHAVDAKGKTRAVYGESARDSIKRLFQNK